MKKYKVVSSIWYLYSLEKSLSYMTVELENPIAANSYRKLFNQALIKLETVANSLPIIDNERLRHLKIRKIRVKRFSILYTIDKKNSTVYVLDIVHSLTNWQKSFKI